MFAFLELSLNFSNTTNATEAVTWKYSIIVLKTLQNLQQNICVRVFLKWSLNKFLFMEHLLWLLQYHNTSAGCSKFLPL